jgi:hypothetical protein
MSAKLFPYHRQDDVTYCGAACLQMVYQWRSRQDANHTGPGSVISQEAVFAQADALCAQDPTKTHLNPCQLEAWLNRYCPGAKTPSEEHQQTPWEALSLLAPSAIGNDGGARFLGTIRACSRLDLPFLLAVGKSAHWVVVWKTEMTPNEKLALFYHDPLPVLGNPGTTHGANYPCACQPLDPTGLSFSAQVVVTSGDANFLVSLQNAFWPHDVLPNDWQAGTYGVFPREAIQAAKEGLPLQNHVEPDFDKSALISWLIERMRGVGAIPSDAFSTLGPPNGGLSVTPKNQPPQGNAFKIASWTHEAASPDPTLTAVTVVTSKDGKVRQLSVLKWLATASINSVDIAAQAAAQAVLKFGLPDIGHIAGDPWLQQNMNVAQLNSSWNPGSKPAPHPQVLLALR